MHWWRTRVTLRWALAIIGAALLATCPLTRWVKAQAALPPSGPRLSVAMAGACVVVNAWVDPMAPGSVPTSVWCNSGPVQWNFWFQFRRTPALTHAVVPLWALAAGPLGAALVLRRAEVPERRRRLGLCPACAYDRRGIEAGACCPECGAKP